ncbi:MAG: VCBS repeat-containing protein [Gemmataceae bacterium]
MRTALILLAAVGLTATAADPPPGFPKFRTQQIASDLSIGYAVLTADINGDGKPDIVIVDKHRVVWYENPTWKVRTILQGKTKPDNVCAVAVDIDGGGDLELVLGANWNAGTAVPGTLQWLKRGKSLDDEWTLHPIPCDEPTVHRMRVVENFYGDGKRHLFVAPLQGRDCTAKGNWTDGRPVQIVVYPIPADPTKPDAWKPQPIGDKFPLGGNDFFCVHNIRPYRDRIAEGMPESGQRWYLLMASNLGPTSLAVGRGRDTGGIFNGAIHYNKQAAANKGGASEIAATRIKSPVYATIEPWHGNQVVTYTMPPMSELPRPWDRHVIDDHLRWGHAIAFADLDGDGMDELVAGVRDDPNPKAGDKFTERRGVRLYRCTDGKGEKWDRFILEDGGVAVEDLAVADLNGDGKPDIVAVGRQTGNCRIYWNEGK